MTPGEARATGGGSCLVIIDMITDYAFPDGEAVARAAGHVVPRVRETRDRADAAGVACVYVNDLVDDWRCSPSQTLTRALGGRHPELVRPLAPRPDDPFFHKGRHSAFVGTPLEHYLSDHAITEVVLAGQVTEQCILYTALDAHIRRYALTVIPDAVVPLDPELSAAALRMMGDNMDARLVPATQWPPPAAVRRGVRTAGAG